jgi:hypothetical protein
MAKILKYGGGITLEQEKYVINGTPADNTVVEFDVTNGGIKACTANAALKALAGMLEGQTTADNGDAAALATGTGEVRALVRPLLPGAIVEFTHAVSGLKVGAPMAISAGGAAVAAAGANPEIGRVVKVVSATVCHVRIG